MTYKEDLEAWEEEQWQKDMETCSTMVRSRPLRDCNPPKHPRPDTRRVERPRRVRWIKTGVLSLREIGAKIMQDKTYGGPHHCE